MASSAMLPDDDLNRVSTTTAEHFTDDYYNTLSSARDRLAAYYVPHSTISPGRDLPLITYNGQQVSDPVAFQKTYTDSMPYTFFEVQSVDAQVMNPAIDHSVTGGRGRIKQQEQNMSLLVQVSGYVRLMERKEGPMRSFSDTMILVPNKTAAGAKGRGKGGEGRSWLIQTQNFRFVV